MRESVFSSAGSTFPGYICTRRCNTHVNKRISEEKSRAAPDNRSMFHQHTRIALFYHHCFIIVLNATCYLRRGLSYRSHLKSALRLNTFLSSRENISLRKESIYNLKNRVFDFANMRIKCMYIIAINIVRYIF